MGVYTTEGVKHGYTRIVIDERINTRGEESRLKEPVNFTVEVRRHGLISKTGGRCYGDVYIIHGSGTCTVNLEKEINSTAPLGATTTHIRRWKVEGTTELYIPEEPDPKGMVGSVTINYTIQNEDGALIEQSIYQSILVKATLTTQEVSNRLVELENQMAEVTEKLGLT